MTDLLGATTPTTVPAAPTTTTTAPMKVNLPPPGGATTTTTAPASTPPASTPPATGSATGSFPMSTTGSSPLDAYLGPAQQILNNLNSSSSGAASFSSEYGVTSAEMPQFLNASGQLNSYAQEWIAFRLMSPSDRLSMENILATAGLLKSTDATGVVSTVGDSAFRSLIGIAASQGTSANSLVTQIDQGGLGQTQTDIQNNLAQAQKNLSAPIAITETNPTTLAAQLTNAFDQALGYAPDQKQIQAFIDQIQGQETTYGSAPRAEAQAQVDLAHSQESALNALGVNGIDSVLQAYQAAVNGTKLPGVGTNQGPVNGSTPNAATPLPAGTPTPGSALPAGVTERYTPQGNLVGGDILPTTTSQTTQAPEGGVAGFVDNNILHKNVTTPTTTSQTSFAHQTAPFAPANAAGSTPTHGGIYALSPQDWAEARKLLPGLIKANTTPGSVGASIQQAAMTALLQNQYDNNGGSWSKAISTIASGTPFGTAKGTHLSAFGDQVAAEVNSQISSLQNQVNTDAVTVKVAQPDAAAEASAAAKSADPVGYYAANAGSWGEVLNQMLAGAPLMYGQGTADTFSGPVSNAVAGTASSNGATPVASVGAK